jgi:hypothetical protein
LLTSRAAKAMLRARFASAVRASSTSPEGHLVQSMDRIEVKTGIHSDPIDETRLAGIIVHANARTLVDHHEIFVLQLYPVHV